jgi:hypothetical protein
VGCIICFASPYKSNEHYYFFMQLVQFLLKQAGIDKRTGDLYGNRDLLNIARNMARGLKVCIEVLQMDVT